MKKIYKFWVGIFLISASSIWATTCPDAIPISTFPVVNQALICGTTNDLNSTTVPDTWCGTTGSNNYKNGQEALYVFTAPESGLYDFSYNGVTWSSIIVYQGCPGDGGVCVGAIGNDLATKSLSVTLIAGEQYFLWFDTWPTPASPCPGTFSISLPPACANVSGLNTTGITTSAATLGWTENGTATNWQIEYGMQGFTQGSGTVIDVTTNPFVLSDLDPATDYSFYVRANCLTDGFSNNWTGPVSFRTSCEAEVAPTVMQNFSTFTGNANVAPICWSEATGNYNTNSTLTPANGAWANQEYNENFSGTHPNGTAAYVNLYGTKADWIISQSIDLGDGTIDLQVEYDVSVTPWTGTAAVTTFGLHYVDVVISTDGGVTWLPANLLKKYDDNDIPTNGGRTEFISLDGYTGVVKIGFFAFSSGFDTDLRFYIDNFRVNEVPNCFNPLGPLVNTQLSLTSASHAWSAPAEAPANGYEWAVTETETPPASGTATTELTATSTDLLPNVNYYLHVRSVCDTDLYSEWVSAAFQVGYCTPIYSFGKTDGDLISNVVIEGTTLANNTGTDPVNPAYTYFTGEPNYTAELVGGQDYNVTVSVGTFGGQHVAVWIDFNEDGEFTIDERIGFTTTAIAANGSGTFSIVLPCEPETGVKRMRVRNVWNTTGVNIDPCSSYGYGETEDYDVTILPAVPVAAPTAEAQALCVGATVANLVAEGQNLLWYNVEEEGEALAGETLLVSGNYYVSQSINGCVSPRTTVAVIVNETEAPVAAAEQVFCASGSVSDLEATGTALAWYADETGGEALAADAALATGTYYVSQTENDCESVRTAVMVTVNVTAAPIAEAQEFCNEAMVSDLEATGTALAWYADETGGEALAADAALATGTYYVSQTENDCESERTAVMVTINVTAAPEGEAAQQVIVSGDVATVADIVISGSNIVWYASEEDALAGTNPLAADAPIEDGATYYAVAFENGCPSEPFAVTVEVYLSTKDVLFGSFNYYPNPVVDVLNISNNEMISNVSIINMLGQEVVSRSFNATNGQINLAHLPSGSYMVRVTVENTVKVVKVVKF